MKHKWKHKRLCIKFPIARKKIRIYNYGSYINIDIHYFKFYYRNKFLF